MDINNNLRSLAKSFSCAFRGLGLCILNERNMRIHLVVAAYVLFFARFYRFGKAEYCLLLFAIGLVLICEMLNTAIEAIVDKISPSYTALARMAKDIAAGAVFVASVFAAVIGLILFFDLFVLQDILNIFLENLIYVLALIVSILISVVFIFKGFRYVRPTDRIMIKKKRG